MPLARLRPRQGRYARVGYAVLIFFVYINLTIAGRHVARARRRCPQWLGLWWVHAAVVLLALAILFDSALSRACALPPQHARIGATAAAAVPA